MTTRTDVSGHPDLQDMRESAGIEQQEVADVLGCSRSAISRFEGGSRRALPGGRGREEYVEALREAVRRRVARLTEEWT